MTKVNIISGFLGAGKTTLIKKLLGGAFEGEKVVLLENEYGEVGIDGGFMKDSGIQVTELNSGCICCTLVGDFSKALGELIETYHPDRILIEPSGVGKLSDIRGVVDDESHRLDLELAGCATVADVSKCRVYLHNFGEFFTDQIKSAETIVLSRTQTASQDRIDKAVALLREQNPRARIVTTPWDELDAKKMLETIEHPDFLLTVDELFAGEEAHGHHHHDHDHEGEEHGHGCCHHDHDDEEHEHGCCHHDHEGEEHEHGCCHHDHEGEKHEHGCCHHDHEDGEHEHGHCGCGHHHHHHGHDADEVFENIGVETPKKFEEADVRAALEALDDEARFGSILRAKGIVPLKDGKWLHFDYVPGEADLRYGPADYTGRLCVIGVKINEPALKELFGV